MTRRLLTLIGGSLAFWLLLAIPARAFWGDSAVVYSATALALCLIPAALTLAGALWSQTRPADQQLTLVMGGTGARLLISAGGGYALTQFVPYFRDQPGPGFLTWLIVFYLFTLILETVLAVAGRPAADAASRPAERVG